MSVFSPTGTSKLLIDSIKSYLKANTNEFHTIGEVLDLGCGNGNIGWNILKDFNDSWYQLFASDISPEAVEYVENHYPKTDVRCGDLFEPWTGHKFNLIFDDVSGISSELAKASPWFDGVPCDSGKDGADLVCKVIQQAPNYLTQGGKLFFPIVSLSNAQRIKKTALDTFENLELLSHTEFPLPKELKDYPMPEEYIKERFGIKLFWTDIYMVSNGT